MVHIKNKKIKKKTLSKLRREGTHLNTINPIYGKPTANVVITEGKTESFSSNFWYKARMPAPATSIQRSTGSPRQSNEAIKM